jgi:hypothetical protein
MADKNKIPAFPSLEKLGLNFREFLVFRISSERERERTYGDFL